MVLYFCHNYSNPYSALQQQQPATTIKRSYKRDRRHPRRISSKLPSDKLTLENRQFLQSLGFEVLV